MFNGISTLFKLFNAKAILLEEQSYLTHSWEDKGVHTFLKGICPKADVIARLEYELAYYDSAVHRFNHYTMRTPTLNFCLVSLFNGISTLFKLFNAKAILLEEQSYLTHSWEDKGVHTFLKGICPKADVIARLEYELAYYDSAVHRFNHYTTRTPTLNFCLVSLFNGISTLFKLFNAKAILLEEQSYLTHSWEDKGVHTFLKGICPKADVIARLEYELAYYDSAVHRFNHYTTRTPPFFTVWIQNSLRYISGIFFVFYKDLIFVDIYIYIYKARERERGCVRVVRNGWRKKT